MNFYPSSYLNAATAAAAAAVSATNSTTMPISDVERFQFLAQSPYFMQNGIMLAKIRVTFLNFTM